MGVYRLGDILKYARMAKAMTQEELSDGICSVETLSRYETGKLKPTSERFSALMNKMNESGERYILPVIDTNIKAKELIDEILFYKGKMEYDVVEEKLNDLLSVDEFDTEEPVNKQFIEFITLIIDVERGMLTKEDYILGLENTIKITFPDYVEEFRLERVFTQTEVNIVNNIASAYAEGGNCENAIKLFKRMLKYFEKYNGIDDNKACNIILENLSTYLTLSGKYKESIKACEAGIKWLVEKKKSGGLYKFLYNVGCNTLNINNMQLPKNSEEYKRAKKYILWSYYLNKMYDDSEVGERIVKKYLEEHFN